MKQSCLLSKINPTRIADIKKGFIFLNNTIIEFLITKFIQITSVFLTDYNFSLPVPRFSSRRGFFASYGGVRRLRLCHTCRRPNDSIWPNKSPLLAVYVSGMKKIMNIICCKSLSYPKSNFTLIQHEYTLLISFIPKTFKLFTSQLLD